MGIEKLRASRPFKKHVKEQELKLLIKILSPRFISHLFKGPLLGFPISFRMDKVSSSLKSLRTIINSLSVVKDPIDPKDMKVVYLIPCSYGIPYIGERGCSINQRIHEHTTNIRHNHSYSSALADHVEKYNNHVCIEDSKFIARVDHFHHRKLREAIKIERRAINFNRDDGWKPSKR